STTMISWSIYVCAQTELIACLRKSSLLRVGITTENSTGWLIQSAIPRLPLLQVIRIRAWRSIIEITYCQLQRNAKLAFVRWQLALRPLENPANGKPCGNRQVPQRLSAKISDQGFEPDP